MLRDYLLRILSPPPPDRHHVLGAALRDAIVQGDHAALSALLKQGADPNQQVDGDAPLRHAAWLERHTMVAALLAVGADPNLVSDGTGATPLTTAVGLQQPDVARMLLAGGADPHRRDRAGRTPLFYASEACLPLLLEANARTDLVDVDGGTPLHQLVRECQVGTIHLLLQHGLDPNAMDYQGKTPLSIVRGFSRYDDWASAPIIHVLAQHGAKDPDDDEPIAHTVLCEQVGLSQLEQLIGDGALVNVADTDGFTPLMAHVSDVEAVKVLLAKGANVDAVDDDGRNALHHAAHEGCERSLRVMILAGGDYAATDNDGRRPIQSIGGRVDAREREAIEMLLRAAMDGAFAAT